MEVRLAEPRDIAAIVDVHIRSSRAAYANLPASVVSVSAEARRVRRAEALQETDSRVWVAEKAGQVVGFCHLRTFPPGTSDAGSAEITSLYIDPAHWHEGLGRALVEQPEEGEVEQLGAFAHRVLRLPRVGPT